MKIVIATTKPRNPLVALSRQRRAGSHRPHAKAHRQLGQESLRRELSHTGAKHHGP